MALIIVEDQKAINTDKIKYLNISTLQPGGIVEIHANFGLVETGDYVEYELIFKGPRKQATFIFNQILEVWYKEEIYIIPKARKLNVEDEKKEYDSLLYIKDQDVHIFINEKFRDYVNITLRIKDRRHYFMFRSKPKIKEHTLNNEEFDVILNEIGLNATKQEKLKAKIKNHLPTGE